MGGWGESYLCSCSEGGVNVVSILEGGTAVALLVGTIIVAIKGGGTTAVAFKG